MDLSICRKRFKWPCEGRPAEPGRIKEALGALGLKTGGTPRERAERLWLTKDRELSEIDKKHFQKGHSASKTPAELAKEKAAAKQSALLEAKVRLLSSPLLCFPPSSPSLFPPLSHARRRVSVCVTHAVQRSCSMRHKSSVAT